MKYAFAILTALILCLGIFTAQFFNEYKQMQFKVYDVENKYAFGPEDADLKIVDFSRFGCDHCQKFFPVLKEAIERDGNIRYMPRIVTFGKVWDETLATAVYAAAEQGKFFEMHEMIYRQWPVESRKKLLLVARSAGLNTEKFQNDLEDPEIIARMRQDQQFFESWMLSRTPSILFGEKMLYQPAGKDVTVEEILEKFESVRK